jgi:hypothetical protein
MHGEAESSRELDVAACKKYGPPVVLLTGVALTAVGAGVTHHAVTALIGAVFVIAAAGGASILQPQTCRGVVLSTVDVHARLLLSALTLPFGEAAHSRDRAVRLDDEENEPWKKSALVSSHGGHACQ